MSHIFDRFRTKKATAQPTERKVYEPLFPDNGEMKVLMPTWMMNPPYGLGRFMRNGEIFNATEIRLLGMSTAVWQCKKRIADAVVGCNWEIKSVDADKPNTQKTEQIKTLLRNPNTNKEGFSQILFAVTMDICDLDAGVIVNVFPKYGSKNRVVQIYSRDGSTILKQIDQYGRIEKYWQYDYKATEAVELETRDITYISMNTRSDSPYGESPTETIRLVIRNLVKGIETQELIYRKGGIPSGVLGLEGMTSADFDSFKAWWDKNLANKVYKQAMINAKVSWQPLITSFADLQFLDTQKWFTELVYRTFKVPHYGLGTGVREAKGAPEEEYKRFMRETVAPYLIAIEQAINQQIIPHFYTNGETPDVYFHFTTLDTLQESEEFELWNKKFDCGAATINEYRKLKNQPPLSWGDCNPMALKIIQQFSQSFWYGAFDGEAFTKLTGIETPITQIVQKLKEQKQE